MYSKRLDLKARGHAEGLETRRDWESKDERNFLPAGHVVMPVSRRCKEVDLRIRIRLNSAFSTNKRKRGALHLHVAARPIPPYRDCVELNQPPRLWEISPFKKNRSYSANRPSMPVRAPLFPPN